MTSHKPIPSATQFSGHLAPGVKPALVMVDFVRAYFEAGAPLFLGSDSALHSAARVLAAARESKIPVIHTRVTYTNGGADGGYFFQKVKQLHVFLDSNPLGEIMSEVEPNATESVIAKQYASAFFGTSLASTLTAQGVDTLIIAGVSTSGCVRATAVDAVQHGFVPLVVRDAVGDRAPGPHESSLYDIEAKYGEVLTEKQILAYLHPLRKLRHSE